MYMYVLSGFGVGTSLDLFCRMISGSDNLTTYIGQPLFLTDRTEVRLKMFEAVVSCYSIKVHIRAEAQWIC